MTISEWWVESSPAIADRWEMVSGPFATQSEAWMEQTILSAQDRSDGGMLHQFRTCIFPR